jgi:hypothetical protein
MVYAKPCSQDKSCQNLHPDTHLRSATVGKARTCPQYKSCTVTVSWLRSYLYRDSRLRSAPPGHDCASAHHQSCNRGYPDSYRDRGSDQPCNATRVMFIKLCTRADRYRQAKSAPPHVLCSCGAGSPSLPAGRQGLHRDSFLAKVSGPCPVLRRVTPTKLYRRAVSKNATKKIGLAP